LRTTHQINSKNELQQNCFDMLLRNTVHTEGKSLAMKQVSFLALISKNPAMPPCDMLPTSVSREPAASPRFQIHVHPVAQQTLSNTAYALDNPLG
jgi:hypothetical protein